MQVVENSNGPSLGIYLNWATWPKASDGDWPEWATLRQREKWREKGLILWDPEARLVTRIDGREAVSFLDHLRNSTVWREDGCTVGEPVWLIPLSEPAEKAKWVLRAVCKQRLARSGRTSTKRPVSRFHPCHSRHKSKPATIARQQAMMAAAPLTFTKPASQAPTVRPARKKAARRIKKRRRPYDRCVNMRVPSQ